MPRTNSLAGSFPLRILPTQCPFHFLKHSIHFFEDYDPRLIVADLTKLVLEGSELVIQLPEGQFHVATVAQEALKGTP